MDKFFVSFSRLGWRQQPNRKCLSAPVAFETLNFWHNFLFRKLSKKGKKKCTGSAVSLSYGFWCSVDVQVIQIHLFRWSLRVCVRQQHCTCCVCVCFSLVPPGSWLGCHIVYSASCCNNTFAHTHLKGVAIKCHHLLTRATVIRQCCSKRAAVRMCQTHPQLSFVALYKVTMRSEDLVISNALKPSWWK